MCNIIYSTCGVVDTKIYQTCHWCMKYDILAYIKWLYWFYHGVVGLVLEIRTLHFVPCSCCLTRFTPILPEYWYLWQLPELVAQPGTGGRSHPAASWASWRKAVDAKRASISCRPSNPLVGSARDTVDAIELNVVAEDWAAWDQPRCRARFQKQL